MSKETNLRAKRPPLTEEQIRTHTIGALKPLQGPIVIVDYDPQWPKVFEREADRIRVALGSRAFQIEHTGSTSVPGLVAKTIIDMLLVVADSADEATYRPAVETAGYLLRIRETNWHEHRMFLGPDTKINLHVFSSGCPEIERMLISVIGSATMLPIAISTHVPSWLWPGRSGNTFRITPTPGPS